MSQATGKVAVVEKKFLKEKTIFQIQKNNNWVDYFMSSKFKLR